jgi:phenylacetic acid degradation operon negative regulatory protein
MSNKASAIDDWIRRDLKKEPPRSKSLIATIFGDSVEPLAAGIWLSDLIELLRPFGVNERLVRTSTSRLAEDGWLASERHGRRSRYSLTESGRRRFEHAYQRIYAPPPSEWDGRWTVVILPKLGNGAPERSELRSELEWEGFGLLASGIFLHPAANTRAVDEILQQLGLSHRAIVARAQDSTDLTGLSLKYIVPQCWNLRMIADSYREFLARFESLAQVLDAASHIAPDQAFIVQTLLIHTFRRVTLHDPRLPAPMLPADWPGHRAYNTCRRLYRMTYRQALNHLAQRIDPGAARKAVPAALTGRFGGLL